MRTTWKRTVVGLLIAGAVGGAALGLARPGGDPPTFIPHADEPPPEVAPVVQAQAVEAVKNDPGVALDWSGPAVVKANQPTEYTLSVRNVCGQNLQKVVVQVRAPKGTEVTATSPEVRPTDGVYLWELGTLEAKTTRSVTVTLKQPAKGDMTCQAWVTLTGTSAMKAVVKEPKLAVTIKAPEKVAVGEKFGVEYTVTNTGDFTEEVILVTPMHSDPAAARGRKDFPPTVRLKPGEANTRKEEFTADTPGVREFPATADAADGVKASAKTAVLFIAPKLDVSVSGPKERLIGTKGKYVITVKNTGEIPVSGVGVRQAIPAGFKVSQAGDAVPTAETLRWSAGDLAPGASKTFEFEGCTHLPGATPFRATAAGDRNTTATAECVTQVEGIPGLRMELVDSVDPVEKGGELTYEIKVTNTGTKADGDVRIVCELPKEMQFVSCDGPTKGDVRQPVVAKVDPARAGGLPSVVFDPISDLAPKTEAVFKVKVKGTGTGDVRFKAVMTSKHLTAPVTKEESTRVYGE